MLKSDEVDAYWRDGYLFPIRVMSEQEAGACRKDLEDMESQWLNADLPKPLNLYKRVNAPLHDAFCRPLGIAPSRPGCCRIHPWIRLCSYGGAEYFIKEPQTEHIVSMHQDLTYWGLGSDVGSGDRLDCTFAFDG